MSNIAFFCIPAHGHTNPTLGVVRELTNRGHRVRYYSNELFREKIEAAGAEFVACDDYDIQMKLTPEDGARVAKDVGFATKILVNTTLALDEMVCGSLREFHADCIVADSMAVWGKCAAMKLGIPFVSSTTTFAFNQHSSKILKQSLGQMLSLLWAIPGIGRDLKRLQDKGYPVNDLLTVIQNDNETNTVVYTSRAFQPCAETFSDRYHFVGPSVRAAGTTLEKGIRPLVYISLGTVNNKMEAFYRSCIETFRDGTYRVILSAGELVDHGMFRDLPENITVERWVDQMAVLEQADVFLSHCGMNSVSESLYCGVPLVLYPQTAEQGGVARRTEQVGAGCFLKKPTEKGIREAVDDVLRNHEYKRQAERIGAGFREAGGAVAAADAILAVIRDAAVNGPEKHIPFQRERKK